MDRSIVRPVLRAAGRNISAGRIANLSFPKNLTITTPTTPRGARNFLNLSHAVGSRGRSQGGGGGGGKDSSCSLRGMIRARCAPVKTKITQPFSFRRRPALQDRLAGLETPASWQAGKPALP